MSIFRPMLAGTVDLTKLKYPVLASPKLDGFRATLRSGKLQTRNGKPIKNMEVNALFSHWLDLDGELIVGDPRDPKCFNSTSRIVTTRDAPATDVMFFVFDQVSEDLFAERLAVASRAIEDHKQMIAVPHTLVMDEKALLHWEEEAVENGYEGIMLRDPKGKYKFGRSTVSEGWLLKMKRFEQSEAIILDVIEMMHNDNEARIDTLGFTERSSHKANMVPMGTMGAVRVKDCETGVEFNIGTGEGLTAEVRKFIWEHKEEAKGRKVRYKYQEYGMIDKPRIGIWLGLVEADAENEEGPRND